MNKMLRSAAWCLGMVCLGSVAWAQPAGPAGANAHVPRVTTVPAPLPRPVPATAEAAPAKPVRAPRQPSPPLVPSVVPSVAPSSAFPAVPARTAREAVPAPVAPSLAAHGLPMAGKDAPPTKAAKLGEGKPVSPAQSTARAATVSPKKPGRNVTASRPSTAGTAKALTRPAKSQLRQEPILVDPPLRKAQAKKKSAVPKRLSGGKPDKPRAARQPVKPQAHKTKARAPLNDGSRP